jgi:hypothetical protein
MLLTGSEYSPSEVPRKKALENLIKYLSPICRLRLKGVKCNHEIFLET